jgi:molybdenum cofactor biosynthesis enzyme MoaA
MEPDKIVEHEEAAHDKRNWVRLTYDCNNGCIFCLDSQAHDGEMRDREEIKHQILDGRRKGATRLILSGGEPTIHPNYIDFIKLGRLAGYRKIQTVTNGRLFAYKPFLSRCLDAGLSEITFSVHGPNARVHDALVAVKGAFEQEMEGLRNALADGRPIVNIDVVINRGNVRHLPEMLELFYGMGVKEFDLLQVIPFGRAFSVGRDTLFYDLDEMQPYIARALEFAKKPDIHLWMNRFPPQHLEGHEHLIQDPYKLNDEVRGRKEEYARLLDDGTPLDCRQPERCRYCYLQRLCDTLDGVRETVRAKTFRAVRVDTRWEAKMGPVFGGDPASAKKARQALEDAQRVGFERAAMGDTFRSGDELRDEGRPRFRLPLLAGKAPTPVPSIEAQVAAAGASLLILEASSLREALPQVTRFPSVTELDLSLEVSDGLCEAIDATGRLAGRRVIRVRTRSVDDARRLLAHAADFEVSVALTRHTAPWLLSLREAPARLALHQPTYERLTENAAHDVDLREFFENFSHAVPVEGVPACVTGRAPPPRVETLDTTMMLPEGRLEIFRYTKRYILEHYRTKSLRCRACVHHDTCDGMHVNYVRAHGYAVMQPVARERPVAQACAGTQPIASK